MLLHTRSWPEVEAYLKYSTGIIIPIGSTEQHGPVGLIGTDAICAEVVAQNLGEILGVMVAPTIAVGMAQHHLGFPGSMALRPSTLLAVICDMVNSLAVQGFDMFFFVNGHGGNIATVKAAFSEIYSESSLRTASTNRPDVRCTLCNWWDSPKFQEICEREFGDSEGSHATVSEVSLTYHIHPEDGERVRKAEMAPGKASEGPIFDAADYRRRFPDGRIGSDPSLASAEMGKIVLEAAIEDLVREYQKFIATE